MSRNVLLANQRCAPWPTRSVVCALGVALLLSADGAAAPAFAQQPLPADLRPVVQIAYPLRDGSGLRPMGSGTIITEHGLILTNEHVFNPPESVVRGENFDPTVAVVLFDHDQDRHTPPEPRYLAEKLAYWYSAFPGEPPYDVAVLRIVRDARTGEPIRNTRFPYVALGNPFVLPDGATVTFLGFPGMGGRNLAHTEGAFVSYQDGNPDPKAPDGSLLFSGNIWGGNSGGAALYDGRLIGLPTAGASGAAVVHPVTWAAPLFTYLRERLGVDAPRIPAEWVTSPRNRDRWTRERATILGVVQDSSGEPVENATVFVFPANGATLEEVRRAHRSDGARAPFVRSGEGRIVYGVDVTDDAGYFSTWIQRGTPFRVGILHQSYRTYVSNAFRPATHYSQRFEAPFRIEAAAEGEVAADGPRLCVVTALRATDVVREPVWLGQRPDVIRTLRVGESVFLRTNVERQLGWVPVWGMHRDAGGRSRLWMGWVSRSAITLSDVCQA